MRKIIDHGFFAQEPIGVIKTNPQEWGIGVLGDWSNGVLEYWWGEARLSETKPREES
jgi:hypothetical protein